MNVWSRRLGPFAPGSTLYVCECGDESCGDLISLPPSEYEHVRSNSAWFLIALDLKILPGGSERILETLEHHHVVEESGAAAARATGKATDIRLNRAAL